MNPLVIHMKQQQYKAQHIDSYSVGHAILLNLALMITELEHWTFLNALSLGKYGSNVVILSIYSPSKP